MDDLISRQAAIDAFDSYILDETTDLNGNTVREVLEDLPSAHPLNPCETCIYKGKGWDKDPCDGCTGTESKYEPERKRGKWLHDKDDVLHSGYCSCCGWESIIMETDVADMPYCPNCGSYNGGGDDEES